MMIKSLIILVVMGLSMGCASLEPKYVGKQFPENPYYLSISETVFTNHSNVTRKVDLKHFILHLKPALNKGDETAQVKGKIVFKEDQVPTHGRIEKFTVHAYILDKNYVCLEKVSLRDLSAYSFGRPFGDDLLFDVTFPFRTNYAYLAFDYKFGYDK